MKKLFVLIIMSILLVSCYTPTRVQHTKYGVVEDVVATNKHHCRYLLKVWCAENSKYYNVYTDTLYQRNSKIIIDR